ncbi:Rha family transcriptional regulator [Pseudomonas fluorescens]|uniref:Rha family transcriptional regulator n=1 Tax=Pseudomonas fluorescens TaxID=294 RepID=UPI0007321EF2|nr:phage regulatory protein/antirepressor Ant [Pseudomonas fluorescens]
MNTSSIQFGQLSGDATQFVESRNVSRSEIVSLVDGEAVTTTLAIAAGCEVDHASVIKLVRTYQADMEEFGRVGFEIQTFQTAGGQQAREIANLNEQQSTLLLTYMRNSMIVRDFKKRLVKEFWRMAHARPAFDIASLNDPKVLLALLTDNVRKVVTLEADNTELTKENHLLEVKVEQDAPKVAFHDMVTVSHKRYNAAQAAKIIGTGRTRLLQFMRQKGWVTRSNEPYQAKIEAGLLDVKLGTFEHPIDGIVPTCSTLITGKGLTKLQAMWQSREEDLLT